MNNRTFTGGDVFKLRALCRGYPGMTEADLYMVLDIYGDFQFYRGWTRSPDSRLIPMFGNDLNPIFILDFV